MDVEAIRPDIELGLADRYFAAREAAELRTLAVAEQVPRFFDYWTSKEAVIKAEGVGMNRALDSFAVLLDDHHDRYRVENIPAEPPSPWTVHRKSWSGFRGAVAVERAVTDVTWIDATLALRSGKWPSNSWPSNGL